MNGNHNTKGEIMEQLTLQYYQPLCSCEGCFRDATELYLMEGEQFSVCGYHKIQLGDIDEHTDDTILRSDVGEALEYREHTFQYNSKP